MCFGAGFRYPHIVPICKRICFESWTSAMRECRSWAPHEFMPRIWTCFHHLAPKQQSVRPPGNVLLQFKCQWWSQICRRLLKIFCDLVLAGASRRMGQAGNIGNPDRDWEGCGQDTKSGCEKWELSMARQHHRVHKTSLWSQEQGDRRKEIQVCCFIGQCVHIQTYGGTAFVQVLSTLMCSCISGAPKNAMNDEDGH